MGGLCCKPNQPFGRKRGVDAEVVSLQTPPADSEARASLVLLGLWGAGPEATPTSRPLIGPFETGGGGGWSGACRRRTD